MFFFFFIFQVYFYEYDILSKPVDKPRQCLPYAIVTVKFIGQKVDNGHHVTSLRVLSGLPKRTGKIVQYSTSVAYELVLQRLNIIF